MPGRPHSETDKARAVELAAEHGIAHAHRTTGIPKQSISRWCTAAGVDLGRVTEKTKAATEASIATMGQRRERLADRLLEIAEMGAERTQQIINEAKPRDLVGLWTRAIHDHLLLTGQATGRVEHSDVRAAAHEAIDQLADRRQPLAA